MSGAVGAAYSQAFLSIGNHIAFGDPLMSGKEFITGIAFGAILGGSINGAVAKYNGNTFWKGTPPRIAVEPISLPKIAGLEKTGTAEIKTSDYTIKSDVKLANTAATTTGPTTEANITSKVTFTQNVDGNGYKVEGLGIKNYNSLQEKFGDTYESVSAVKGKYINIEYGKNLNLNSEGVYYKVYEGGILNGSKVEVHYFYNTTTNQYSNPYIQQGKWSSYLNTSK